MNAFNEQFKSINQSFVNYPEHLTILDYFKNQVERTPDLPALFFEDKIMTYRELDKKTDLLAGYLLKKNISKGSLVSLFFERSFEMVIAILGTVKSGAAYSPIDPQYPINRISYIIEDTNSEIILTQSKYLHILEEQNRDILCLDSQWHLIECENSSLPETSIRGNDTSYVIYTSGSTGKPKGAMNTHRGLLNRILWMQDYFQIDINDKVLQKTPYSFDVSVWEFFWPLITGAGLVIAKPEGHKDTQYLAEIIEKQNISVIHFVPSMLQIFLEEKKIQHIENLKKVICSGEALPLSIVNRFYDLCSGELFNLYGPTEAAIDVTYWKCVPGGINGIVPIGKPIANTQIYILKENGEIAGIGEEGELHIGGIGLAKGYLNLPEITQQKFINNPFSDNPEEKLYKTGDLARLLEDGNIEYLGRIDFQVKLRGFRIELNEIEKVLDTYPGILQSVVVLYEDTPGNKQLIAYYLNNNNEEIPKSKIMDYLKLFLPDYMTPSFYIKMNQFPLTHNGKIDRKNLPLPVKQIVNENNFSQPETDIEKDLAKIWSKILNYDQISIHDDFLYLGGHSIAAIQILSQVNDLYQLSIPLGEFLTGGRTIKTFGKMIEEKLIQSIDPEDMKMLMAELDGLSEEDILQILSQTE